MSAYLDSANVIDIESTCWNGECPPGMYSEVIEVGICEVSLLDLHVTSKRSILVKPTHSTVSSFCEKLTGHTQNELEDEGITLDKACDILRDEYNSRNRVFVSWGNYDRVQFYSECSRKDILNPFSSTTHFNLKNFFSLLYNLKHEIGIGRACHLLGIQMTGRHHNGADDAENVARVFARIVGNARIAGKE
jgi:inhibitor of KinA sporulation pathway (predicted exonuclease)